MKLVFTDGETIREVSSSPVRHCEAGFLQTGKLSERLVVPLYAIVKLVFTDGNTIREVGSSPIRYREACSYRRGNYQRG